MSSPVVINPNVRLDALTIQILIGLGYRRTSRAYGHIVRVDCPLWKLRMAEKHAPWDVTGEGLSWVAALGDSAPDHYRRVYSKDILVLRKDDALRIPGSGHDPIAFVE